MKSMNDIIVEQSLNTCNTHKQYESLAALPDQGHWIEWHGGECPVEKGTLVDVKHGDGSEHLNGPAGVAFSAAFSWRHDNKYPYANIIAWRLHQPEPAAWNGEGLPPVGCECEVKRATDWQSCEIMFISEKHALINLEGGEICWHTQSCQFRPIRTEAERKREAAIKAMFNCSAVLLSPTDTFTLIYDAIAAGEIPGVKLED